MNWWIFDFRDVGRKPEFEGPSTLLRLSTLSGEGATFLRKFVFLVDGQYGIGQSPLYCLLRDSTLLECRALLASNGAVFVDALLLFFRLLSSFS